MLKESLSATSALVLLWTDRSLYATQIVKSYWEKLNLSAGVLLYEKCNAIWPRYERVINDRKWLISNWSKKILARNEMFQVIIFAAGWAPLGLELAELYQKCRVFELDSDNMESKAELVAGISGAPKNICFVSANISDLKQCANALAKSGWSRTQPSLLIIEGISYYISRADLMRIFELAADKSQAILEYMVHYSQVEVARREIPQRVFETIANECALRSPIETWDIEQIREGVPGTIIDKVTLCDIEKMRCDSTLQDSSLFPVPASGWIEIANIEIQKPGIFKAV